MDVTKQRTILIYTIASLFIVAVAWTLFIYFSAATLTVITDDPSNLILVSENSPNKRGVDDGQTGGRATFRVEAGNYTVTVKNDATSAAQVIDLGVGESKTVTLDLTVVTSAKITPQPVTSFGAKSVVASDDKLSFIDKNNSNTPLYTVDKNNRVSIIDSRHIYSSVAWADSDFGIGYIATGASNHGVVKINGQTVTQLTLPFTANKPLTYAVSKNRTWYVSDGHTIYRANGDNSFTKVYTTNKTVAVVSASNDAVLFTVRDDASNREGKIDVLHINGVKYERDGELYESTWSPLGDKVIISSDSTSGIFDDKLNFTHSLPQGNIVSPVWLDDKNFAYILASNVWRYDITNGKAGIISSIDSTVGTPSSIVPDKNSNYLYLSIYRAGYTNPTFMLDRISIGSARQPDSTIAGRLNIIFPHVDSACVVNFVEFTSLSVVTRQITPGQNCIATAKNSIVSSKILNSSSASRLNYQQIK